MDMLSKPTCFCFINLQPVLDVKQILIRASLLILSFSIQIVPFCRAQNMNSRFGEQNAFILMSKL